MAAKKPIISLLVTEAQVNSYITTLAEAQIAAEDAVNRANAKIAAIKADLAEDLTFQQSVITRCSMALFTYFEKNRDILTDGGKRQSCAFTTGVLGNRWTPPRTQFKDEEAVEQYVVAHGMTNFYTQKTVLRRDAMLLNPALARTIPGVKIVRDRIIFAKPDNFDTVIDLKKKIEEAA